MSAHTYTITDPYDTSDLGTPPVLCNLNLIAMTVGMNAEGKLRLTIEGKQPMRLYATIDELRADNDWRSRVEVQPSKHGEGKFYAVLLGSKYVDVDV